MYLQCAILCITIPEVLKNKLQGLQAFPNMWNREDPVDCIPASEADDGVKYVIKEQKISLLCRHTSWF